MRILPHPGEAAVVFRTRAQADVIAGALRTAGLPYSLHGHTDLFGTRVARDLLAYLRLAVNPTDRAALARIVDVPRRRLGRLAATLLEEPATTAELPARAADFGPDAVSAAAVVMATVYDLHAQASRGVAPGALLDRALDRSGYRAWLEHHPDGTRRLRLLARLRALAQRVDVSLAEWLDAAALGEDLVSADEEATRLSSVHMAKGREWRATFMIGLEEGLVPHYRALVQAQERPDGDALEEELRGFYVGLTRARERLFLSACLQRSRGEQAEPRQPSRWLHALPPDLLVAARSMLTLPEMQPIRAAPSASTSRHSNTRSPSRRSSHATGSSFVVRAAPPLGGVRSTQMAAGPTFIYGRTLVHGGASGATSEATSSASSSWPRVSVSVRPKSA